MPRVGSVLPQNSMPLFTINEMVIEILGSDESWHAAKVDAISHYMALPAILMPLNCIGALHQSFKRWKLTQ